MRKRDEWVEEIDGVARWRTREFLATPVLLLLATSVLLPLPLLLAMSVIPPSPSRAEG